MRLCDLPFLHLHFTQFRSIGSRDDRPCNLNRWIFLHPIRHRSLVLRTIIALDSSTLLSSNACAVSMSIHRIPARVSEHRVRADVTAKDMYNGWEKRGRWEEGRFA